MGVTIENMDNPTRPTKPSRGWRRGDDREIILGVQFYENGKMVTYAGDDPETLDALAARLSQSQLDRLLKTGALKGSWVVSGDEPLPMPGSRADRAAAGSDTARQQIRDQEFARMQQELDTLKAKIGDSAA